MIKNKRIRRKNTIRQKIFGKANFPRITIYKSLKSLYVQAVDDFSSHTICSALVKGKKNKKAALELADKFSEQLKQKSIEKVKFDRNGYKYCGVLKTFADELRNKSIKL
jgi:large subunit ribosomal protein L18